MVKSWVPKENKREKTAGGKTTAPAREKNQLPVDNT